MKKIRYWILKFITPVTRLMGRIELHQILMPDTAYEELDTLLENGDVIISRRMWALSNIGIPGFYKHATIFRGGNVVEAIGTGVQEVPLPKWLYTHDYACVLRAKFANLNQRYIAADRAHAMVGLPYDFEFEPGVKAFYCSELVYWAYQTAMNGASPFTLRKTFGVDTVSPMDFLMATDKFEKIWETKR